MINGGNVTYTPGGDLFVQNGGILQINEAGRRRRKCTIQMAGGTLNVAGGVFNQGSSDNGNEECLTTVINVSSGTANFNGNLIYDSANTGQLNITGGTVNVAMSLSRLRRLT